MENIMEKNPNPTKDQHFMVDSGMLELIYETANIQEGESIVEIGGGAGALTDYLVRGNNYITVIEKDPYYAKLLREKYKDYQNVTVIEGDALNFSYESYDRVVANLPYTITEPFLINLASTGALNYNPRDPKGSNVKSVTLVLSQNSTRKIVAPVQITEGKSRHLNQEFGIMGAISKSFCDVDIVSAIPSEAFFPEPAVTSFVVNLTPKKEKTTVDRIMREFLMDKKGNKPSIKRIYQLMLLRGEIYKTNKHKNNLSTSVSDSFTSKLIEDKNVYDLCHAQISQLVQDLIKNDISIKSRNQGNSRSKSNDDCTAFFTGNMGAYNLSLSDFLTEDDYEDWAEDEEYFDDYDETSSKYSKQKFEKKYDYMYDSTRYDVLLQRGLEYIDSEELQFMLNNNNKAEECKVLKLK